MANFEIDQAANAGEPGLVPAVLPGSEKHEIRILLADEPSVFRDGLRALLTAQSDLTVVAEAEDAESILELAKQSRPDVILFEPEGTGTALSVLKALHEEKLPCRVILLTSSEDSELLSQAVGHGVAGIVRKKSPTETLLKSIRKVSNGELWLDRTTTAEVVRQLRGRPIPMPRNIPQTDKPAALSRREREIVGYVAQGFRNREMADKLFISEQTVKNHMHNIFEKVGVQDRLELALYAIYHRLY